MIAQIANGICDAFGFLTILPVGHRRVQDLGKSIVYFPLVGLFIGICLWLQHSFLATWLHPSLNALGVVCINAVWTRGLHLDGLADSADALLSHRSAQRMLQIMRDSRIGTMGGLALLFDVLLRWQILLHIAPGHVAAALILCPVLSRMAMGIGILAFPCARASGMARAFSQGARSTDCIGLLALGALCAFLVAGIHGFFFWSFAILLAVGICKRVVKLLGGFTGDILGALNEVTEIACLALFALRP